MSFGNCKTGNVEMLNKDLCLVLAKMKSDFYTSQKWNKNTGRLSVMQWNQQCFALLVVCIMYAILCICEASADPVQIWFRRDVIESELPHFYRLPHRVTVLLRFVNNCCDFWTVWIYVVCRLKFVICSSNFCLSHFTRFCNDDNNWSDSIL